MMKQTTANQQSLTPPLAAKQPTSRTLHGVTLEDDYAWLRERDNPATLAYLKDENAYTETVMKRVAPLENELYDEMLGRIKQDDQSVVTQYGDYLYYYRYEKGREYRIYCRRHQTMSAKEEVLLDLNEFAKQHNYVRLGLYRISANQRFLAYSLDTVGAETFSIRIKDLDTGKLLPDRIENAHPSLEWYNDNRTLVYVTLDKSHRPYRVYRHTLGAKQDKDELLHEEKDASYFVRVDKTRDNAYVYAEIGSKMTSEIRYLPANDPSQPLHILLPRRHGVEYYMEHHSKRFFILTNEEAKNFRIMEMPDKDPSRERWTELVPHRPDVKIESINAFKKYLVVGERYNGLHSIQIIDLQQGGEHSVQFKEPIYTAEPYFSPEFESDIVRIAYSSLITPHTIYAYDMTKRNLTQLKQQEVLGGYNPDDFTMERVWARAQDGTRIPISLAYKKGLKKDGSNPMLLMGYGSYGISYDPHFSSYRLVYLERGFVYGIAHIRGGGELGEQWYEDGKLQRKKNTFSDFIAAARYVSKKKYTSPKKLTISGGSAGGLLVGAVLNQSPGITGTALLVVPFLDVLNTMLDPSLPLTVTEYEEWGNPNEKEAFQYIQSYAPYENIRKATYPNILVLTSFHDTRVEYWEPAKWVAKMRRLKTDSNLLLLKTHMESGHAGTTGRYQQLKELAMEAAFVIGIQQGRLQR